MTEHTSPKFHRIEIKNWSHTDYSYLINNHLGWVTDDEKYYEFFTEENKNKMELYLNQITANNWEETAKFHLKNEKWLTLLIKRIGSSFGEEAYTSDDGTVNDEVLLLRVPELCAKMQQDNRNMKEALEVLKQKRKHLLDIEQEILKCWEITDDIKIIVDPDTKDSISTEDALSLARVYEFKFNKLWNTFEKLCEINKIKC